MVLFTLHFIETLAVPVQDKFYLKMDIYITEIISYHIILAFALKYKLVDW